MRELSFNLVNNFIKDSGLKEPFVAMKPNGIDLKFYYFKNEKNPSSFFFLSFLSSNKSNIPISFLLIYKNYTIKKLINYL